MTFLQCMGESAELLFRKRVAPEIRQAVWNVEHRNETHKQDKNRRKKMQLGSALEFEPHYSKLLNNFAFAGVIGPLFSLAAVCEFKGRVTG